MEPHASTDVAVRNIQIGARQSTSEIHYLWPSHLWHYTRMIMITVACKALKSGWVQGDGTPPAGSRGRGWGRSPQKPDIFEQFADVKCFSMQVCCRVCPPSPPIPQKFLRICANPMTQHGRGRVGIHAHPTRGYAAGWWWWRQRRWRRRRRWWLIINT